MEKEVAVIKAFLEWNDPPEGRVSLVNKIEHNWIFHSRNALISVSSENNLNMFFLAHEHAENCKGQQHLLWHNSLCVNSLDPINIPLQEPFDNCVFRHISVPLKQLLICHKDYEATVTHLMRFILIRLGEHSTPVLPMVSDRNERSVGSGVQGNSVHYIFSSSLQRESEEPSKS